MLALGLALRSGSVSSRASGSEPRRHLHVLRSVGSASSSPPLSARSSVCNRPPQSTLNQKRYRSSSHSTAPLHPTPVILAAVEGTTSSSDSGGSPYVYHPFADIRSDRVKTVLPVPLPSELTDQRRLAFKRHIRMSKQAPSQAESSTLEGFDEGTMQSLNENDGYFTPSQTAEDLAILRACLATGLVQRATKVFDLMREDVAFRIKHAGSSSQASTSSSRSSTIGQFASPLDVGIYNSMIGTFLRRAFQEESNIEARKWLNKAWSLFHEMEKGVGKDYTTLADPIPDEDTYAVMARALTRFRRSNRLPADMDDMTTLLGSLRRSGLRLHDVLTGPIFSRQQGDMVNLGGHQQTLQGEPDARVVLQTLGSVVAEMGDLVLSSELDEISRIFQGQEVEAKKEAITSSEERTSSREPLEELPELRPVVSTRRDRSGQVKENQVNLNLQILRENLSIVQEARESSAEPYERQHWLEFGALDAARKRFEAGEAHMSLIGLSNTGSLQKRDLQRWMWAWYKKLETVLAQDIQRLLLEEKSTAKPSSFIDSQVLPFLQLLTPEKMAMITILELMRMQATSTMDGMKTASAVVTIGKSIEREHYANLLQKNPEYLRNKRTIQTMLREGGLTNVLIRRQLAKKFSDEDLRHNMNSADWTTNIRARVGSYLIQHLMEVATVRRSATDRDGVTWDEDQPAFYSAYQYIQGKRLGVIRLNDLVQHRLARDAAMETLHPRYLPMLVPPNAWIRYDSGGYLSVKTKALRFKNDFEQASYLKAASDNGSLESVLSGLDVLGSTAWTINKDIFKIVSEVWNSGKSLAEVPALDSDEPEPIRPDNYDTDMRARADHLFRLKQYNVDRMSEHGQRCDVNYRLEIARAFINERFYLPHNMDFRGRAYPIPPHLNHIGNDLSRGLLLFADAKPLGAVGLKWLRIHLSNVYGYDKASFSERENFALDHEADMRKSVADPLGEGNWWLQADDPWQCLATCMELVKALDHPEGPEKYECRLPVHQDGTCNGLQHYAALGGDITGAEQVNLRGKDRPADVYTAVADLVIDVVKADAEAGDACAILLEGKITRKVVKQTVMTTVYGVTFVGAKNQIAKQLVERSGMKGADVWVLSSYLAKKVLNCIGDLFSGAEAIQRWLSESALLIAKSIPPERLGSIPAQTPDTTPQKRKANINKEQMTSVIWTTPLGLPVVQPYRKDVRKQVTTSLQSVFIQDPNLASQVSPGKQASAFPPNFIHSLDATHMFLTALECQNAGLTFASVHDSYWTHACDIETMSDIIRDTFVRLHSCDILPKLREEVSTPLLFVMRVVC
jgi:DNA-directed RNA polymerase